MAFSQADIATQRGQAWEVFGNMKAIWCSTELPLHLTVRIFHSTFLSILLYGSEAWSLTKAMTSKFDSCSTRWYGYMLDVKRTFWVWNEAILQVVCQKPFSTGIPISSLEIHLTTHGNRQHSGGILHGAGPWRMPEFGGLSHPYWILILLDMFTLFDMLMVCILTDSHVLM